MKKKKTKIMGNVFKLIHSNTYIFEQINTNIYDFQIHTKFRGEKRSNKIYGVWPDTIEFRYYFFSAGSGENNIGRLISG